jgi:anti-sigma regulatory factor (Ser/Thr protein kinase)
VEPLRLRVVASSDLPLCRARMRAWLLAALPEEQTGDVLLACGEAVDNALEHGRPPIDVELCWLDGGELAIEVHDGGPWTITGERRDRGFGMPIMTSLMDAVSVDTTKGTTVRLRRRFAPEENA